MNDRKITREDLDWWLDFAATREWTFASTYANTAPHDYIVAGRTPQMTLKDAVRAARVIHTFGTPGKYYSLTKVYLESPDRSTRWWTEDRHFTDATLVNRAKMDRCYGIQNAHTTATGIATAFDGEATFWDEQHPITSEEPDRVQALLKPMHGKYPPHVLDIGCGTGRVLDLGLVSPDRYAALDFSQGMLNVLLRKHPRVAAVYPTDVRDALAAGVFTPRQFDWVFLDANVHLKAEQFDEVKGLAQRATVVVDGEQWSVLDIHAGSGDRMRADVRSPAVSS